MDVGVHIAYLNHFKDNVAPGILQQDLVNWVMASSVHFKTLAQVIIEDCPERGVHHLEPLSVNWRMRIRCFTIIPE